MRPIARPYPRASRQQQTRRRERGEKDLHPHGPGAGHIKGNVLAAARAFDRYAADSFGGSAKLDRDVGIVLGPARLFLAVGGAAGQELGRNETPEFGVQLHGPPRSWRKATTQV